MDFQSNGSNSENATSGLTEATPIFNGTSSVKRVIADPARENVLVLPAGVSLDDIDVRGDDLVIKLPDGTEMIVINGAIYMPEIVINGVTVPPMNLAALLDSDVPEPAAGNPRSSGGNFADAVNPIDPAYDIGDLLPYTELFFPEPQDEEIIPGLVNNVPEITFIPETGDGTIVDEDGLPSRDGEPAGTMDETDDETTTGTIRYVSPDGTDRLLIDGQDIFELNDAGEVVILEPFVTGYPLGNGVLVINAVDIVNGSITYTYTLGDNTSGDNTFVEFDITVIDPEGDSDTGTARIDIIDDAPFTNDDGLLATLDDGAADVVVGTVAQLLQNDEYGADGAGSPAITISTGSLGGTITIVNGELVYTSGANVAPGDVETETFTYTIRDGDGDVSNTSTFTIRLTDEGPTIGSGPADIAATIAVDEEGLDGIAGGPENDLPGEATVQVGTLAGLSYGGDGPGDVVLTGATYSQLQTQAGNSVTTTWNAATHTLTGKDSVTGDTVFTIELTTDADGVPTGEYTFTLLSPVVHPDGGGENDVTFQITAVITDSEGDADTGFINITIDDDSPVIDAVEDYRPADATLDESPDGEDTGDTAGDLEGGPATAPAGLASVDFDFTDAFSLSNDPDSDQSGFGADGPGEVTYNLLLSANGLASGMFALDNTDTETVIDGYGQGEAILLYQVDDNTVIGYVGDSPDSPDAAYDVYFTITVDPETGEGTFTQALNIWHADTTSDDDTSELNVVGGTLLLQATATDFDNDSSEPASLDIGQGVFEIQDDGPALTISAVSEQDDGDLIATTSDSNLPDSDTSLSLTSFFDVTLADYGTDGEGSLDATYGLNIISSDTTLSSGGVPITLVYGTAVDGEVSVVGMAGDVPVFTITVDTATGALTLDQSAPIDHAADSDTTILGAGVLEATYDVVITDADGDTETRDAAIDLGDNIVLNDAFPDITVDDEYVADPAILDESPAGQDEDDDATVADATPPAGTDTVNFDFTDAFSLSNDPNSDQSGFGADGPGEVTYALNLTVNYIASGLFALDVTDGETIVDAYGKGEAILLYQVDDNTVIGYVGDQPDSPDAVYDVYFTIEVDPETGEGTFTQALNIWHADTTNDDDTSALNVVGGDLFLEATATDFDLDQSEPAQLNIGHNVFQIQDDGPSVDQNSADTDGVSAADPLVAAEGNLLANDTVGTDSDGDFNGRVIEITYGVTSDELGADGLGALVLITEYGTLTVQQNGDYSFLLDPTNPEILALASQDTLDVEFTYTFTDGDGDPESQTLTITIAGSNQPPVGAPEAVTVSEEGLVDDEANPIGNPDGTDDPYNVGNPAGQDDTNLATISGQFVFTDADDGDTLTYSIVAPVGTYYAADGSVISWSSSTVSGITTLTGTAGVDGPTVMTVVLDKSSGEYDVYLEGPVYHDLTPMTLPTTDADGLPVGDGNVESEFSIVFGVQVSDGIATVDTSLTVTIEDDSPIVTSDDAFSAPNLIVDDTDLDFASGNFAGAFDISFGGDGEFDALYALGLSEQGVASGLTETASGLAINLFLIDGTIYGSTALLEANVDVDGMTNIAFTIDVDGEGLVTLDQLTAVVHDDIFDSSEPAPLAAQQLASAGLVTLTATAYDQDGDHDSATVDIGDAFFFEDDGPSIVVDTPSDTGVLVTSDADIVDSTSTDTTIPIDPDATLNLADVFGYSSPDYGNDGPGTIVELYGLQIVDDGPTGLTSGGLPITLEYYDDLVSGTTSVRGVTSEGTVFTVVVNDTTGAVTLTQSAVLDHDADTDQIPLPNGFLEATYSATITDGDGDFTGNSTSIDLGGNLLFNDDAPDIEAQGTPATFVLDESPLPADGGDGIYSVTKSYAAFFTLSNANPDAAGFGNDTPGSVSYALNLSVQDVFSGLYALDNTDTETAIDPVGQGEAIKLYQLDDGTIIGYTGDSPSDEAGSYTTFFTISVNEANGDVTFAYDDQIDPANIWHGSTASDDDTQLIDGIQLDTNVLTLQATATDFDTDSDTASIDLGQGTFQIQDDGPDIETPASDSSFSATGSDTYPLLATGTLGFDVGTDGYFGDSVDEAFSFDLKSGTVAGVAIYGITDPVYDPITGTWTFTFQYTDNNGDTQTAGGFIDVAANGTDYTVALDSDFEFTTVDQFSDVISRTGYNLTGNSPSQYEIVVSQLDTDDPVFVQFQAYNGTLAADGNTQLIGGETVTGSETWASISNTENGVAGDTIQAGEVLDFDLFTSNPGGTYSDNGTLGADGLTLLLDGFGSEDLIVILKLEDANDPTNTTTKILIVGQEDVYTNGDVIVGYSVTLDQNDGFIVIESNDFNTADTNDTNWVITGAQLLSSANGLLDTSTGIELNGAVGSGGATTQTTVTFATAGDMYDNDVVKITDIGLIRTVTDEQAVTLNFDVTVKDGDGDTETDSFTVNPIIPPVVLDLDGDGVELLSMAAGVMYDYGNGLGEVSTAWVAPDDGILANWTGGAFTAENFVFGDSERTDLEAIAQDYDGNSDGVLSGEELNGFGVWVDANTDGVFDEGEFSTLADMGITEVSVTQTSAGYIAADGDAIVYGESTYTMDGNVYALADVGFATSTDYEAEPEANQLRQAELALLAAAAPGLLVASALDATPFFAADHMVNFEPTDLSFATAVNSITRHDVDLSHVDPASHAEGSDKAQHAKSDSAHLSDDDSVDTRAFGGDHGAPANDVADLGASTETAANFAPPPTPVGGAEVGADVLAALLNIGAPAADAKGDAKGTQALDAVRTAITEVTGSDEVSKIVNHIIDNVSETAQHGHVGTEAMQVLLNSGVAGQHFQMPMLADAADDAAHLAAAAA